MFREYGANRQSTFMDATDWMDKRTLERLNKSWAPIFFSEVFSKIDESRFAPLYSNTGAPNFPVNVLLSLEYIKYMKGWVDQELLEAYNFDFLVNYAVGNRSIGEMPMAERTLYNFRSRVYQYSIDNPDSDDILFGQFQGLLHNFAEKSDISMKEQRMDTTMFMSNIKKAGRLALAYDVLMSAVKAIPENMLTETLAEVMLPKFKTDTLYRVKAADGEKKLDQIMGYCKEASGILAGIPEADEIAALVKRFLYEQSETDKEGRIRAKSKYVIRADSLQSAYDTDATYHRKADVGQSGYVLEISETCVADNPYQLVTDYRVEKNNVSDVEILGDRIGGIHENTGCEDMYVDGGFNSPGTADAAKKAEVELHFTNLSGSQPSKNIPVEEYKIDEETNKILLCPAGNAPMRSDVTKDQTVARFELDVCKSCEMRDACRVKLLKAEAVVRISIKTVDASRERVKMNTEKVENTSKRAGIEGSNSALKRKGLKKLGVRGIAKSRVVSGLMVTVQNIKRFTKYMLGGYDAAIRKKISRRLEVCPN